MKYILFSILLRGRRFSVCFHMAPERQTDVMALPRVSTLVLAGIGVVVLAIELAT